MISNELRGLHDLHCHWVATIDDGARSEDDGVRMLERLAEVGFATVYATPHMRIGMFENDKPALQAAYARMDAPIERALSRGAKLPRRLLASEHFFDDTVFRRLTAGEGLPYPRLPRLPRLPRTDGGEDPLSKSPHAVLVELPPDRFPLRLVDRFLDLKRAGLTPVLAHPERYAPVWASDACLDPILDAGAFLLLDVCALVGKYGRASEKAATKLLEDGAYEAACTDAHKPSDVDTVATALERLVKLAGAEEARRLFVAGPERIVSGV